ncbi:hypothetical protein [Lysobacter sp. 1R34A]|uniref:hypothetical protein n=1 Tax=Lysobacter sp. 1R34A TaxID=3445786 RepID=UPI003EEFD834
MCNVTTSRFIFVLVLLFLPALAYAENYHGTTEGDAKAKCEASKAKIASKFPAECVHYPNHSPKEWSCEGRGNGAGYGCDGLLQFFLEPRPSGVYGHHYYQTACASLTPTQTRANMSRHPNLSVFCDGGCERKFQHGTDPEDKFTVTDGPYAGYWIWGTGTATGKTCDPNDPDGDKPPKEPPPPECTKTQKRLPDGKCVDNNDECPVGQHMAAGKCTPDGACPTGQVKGPDGSCVDEGCPAGQAKGKDGTCKKDADGDGKPDDGEGDDGRFSGGDTCDEPPKCSGDAILCGQARIQWRIDCNTRRKFTVTDSSGCSAPPVCVGKNCDALEYSQLLQQWRTTCAINALIAAQQPGTPGGGDGVVEYMTNARATEAGALNAIASGTDGTEGLSVDQAWAAPSSGNIDEGLFGGGSPGSCGVMVSTTFFGHQIFDMPPEFWRLGQMIGWLLVALAYLWVAFKLGD